MLAPPLDTASVGGGGSAGESTPRRVGSLTAKSSPPSKAWHTLARIPREGPLDGGGAMRVYDRIKVAEVEMYSQDATSAADLTARGGRGARDAATRKKAFDRSHTPGSEGTKSGTADNPKTPLEEESVQNQVAKSQAERRKAELQAKFDKAEAQRQRDRQGITERLQRNKGMRDERFNRLVDHVLGRDNLAYQTAIAIREREAHQDKRRRELHLAWDEKVAQPLEQQAHKHMNPPNRAQQQALSGSKSVDFLLPGTEASLVAVVEHDPVKQQIVDMAKENAFHQAASAVLGHVQSSPNLRSRPARTLPHPQEPPCLAASPLPTRSPLIPQGRSRPTLEPQSWHPSQLQGSMLGHFAQAAEHGPGFKRVLRGGADVHAHDESDGVEAAGKRTTRANGHKDLGILKGNLAAHGESSLSKTMLGASSGAILQDHFQFETGTKVTDIEFPLGKRTFPQLTGAIF
mmetsp:Transcript_43223/g.101665  ORF Transcript_43223/g.101665 Transcript_43223/m.101665 type:complete len:460 (+) Transcript_43223:106-1485(+)